MSNLIDLILNNGLSRILQCLSQKLQLLLGLAQLLQHSSLFKNGMGCHEILTSRVSADKLIVLCIIAHDNHQNANDFLRLRKLGTRITVEFSLQLFNLLQLAESILKIATSDVYKGNIPLDFTSAHVLHTI